MEKIIISETGADCSHIAYLYHTLGGEARAAGSALHLSLGGERVALELSLKKEKADGMKKRVASAVADVIAIGYKYVYLRKILPFPAMDSADREILLAALIAADFPDDKAYILKKLSHAKEYAIDGFFNFRLQPLKEKWNEIALYLPDRFSPAEFDKFVAFLLESESGKIYVKDSEVFDEGYQKMRRSRLIGNFPEYSFLREVILSGARRICCLSVPSSEECGFLKKYYGSRVFFG